MVAVVYGSADSTMAREVAEFYDRLGHDIDAHTQQMGAMINNSVAFVTARVDGALIGLARGVCDGVRGFFTECKLDPAYQGPAAVTRHDGRIEHDEQGIAAEMARRVLEKLMEAGAQRVDVLAWGTEVDFLKELGFRKQGGLVGMTMRPEQWVVLANRGKAGDLLAKDRSESGPTRDRSTKTLR
jgi:hypothetical protein